VSLGLDRLVGSLASSSFASEWFCFLGPQRCAVLHQFTLKSECFPTWSLERPDAALALWLHRVLLRFCAESGAPGHRLNNLFDQFSFGVWITARSHWQLSGLSQGTAIVIFNNTGLAVDGHFADLQPTAGTLLLGAGTSDMVLLFCLNDAFFFQ
jgi:hypothetical protein